MNSLEDLFARPWKDLCSEVQALFSLVAKFGIPGVILVCGVAPFSGPNEGFLKFFPRLKKLAVSYGVKLLYEYIGFPNHALSQVEEAIKLARK